MNRFLFPAVFLLLIISGCDNPGQDNNNLMNSTELQALSDGLVFDLELSKSGTKDLNDILRRHGGRGMSQDPGFLWRVAAELQQTLSGEEKSVLFERMDDHYLNIFRQNFRFNKKDHRYGQKGAVALRGIRNVLTEDQVAVFEEILKSHSQKMVEIKSQVQAGSITREEAHDQIQTLGETLKAEIEALLSSEQLAALEQKQAEHEFEGKDRRNMEAHGEEVKAVMYEVLNLTGDQITAFEAINEDAKIAITALKDELKNGSINREDFREAAESIFTERNEKLAEILTDTDLEIIKIRNALQLRMDNHRKMSRNRGGRMWNE
ncbi:MAG: hypothetical protein V3S22_01750 [Candidatus Neomarinimicrobiota bacterium]